MKYSIRKISKKLGRFEEFQEIICVCASDGENVSVIAEIHDHGICEEHGTPELWAEKIVLALSGRQERNVSIIESAESIINSERSWDDKYDLIFSEEISKEFSRQYPQFEYCDPDSSYEDDVLAWFNAAKYHAQ